MDRHQADAIADAILQPDLAHRETLARRRAEENARLAGQRHVAKWTLTGSASGAAIALMIGQSIAEGVTWGGPAAAVLGWTAVRVRRARKARAGGRP